MTCQSGGLCQNFEFETPLAKGVQNCRHDAFTLLGISISKYMALQLQSELSVYSFRHLDKGYVKYYPRPWRSRRSHTAANHDCQNTCSSPRRDRLQRVYLGSSQRYILVRVIMDHNNLQNQLSYVTARRLPDNSRTTKLYQSWKADD